MYLPIYRGLGGRYTSSSIILNSLSVSPYSSGVSRVVVFIFETNLINEFEDIFGVARTLSQSQRSLSASICNSTAIRAAC